MGTVGESERRGRTVDIVYSGVPTTLVRKQIWVLKYLNCCLKVRTLLKTIRSCQTSKEVIFRRDSKVKYHHTKTIQKSLNTPRTISDHIVIRVYHGALRHCLCFKNAANELINIVSHCSYCPCVVQLIAVMPLAQS